MVINIGNILLKKLNPLSIALLGTIIGYLINLTHNESIPDIIANTATGLCFFSLGYWMQGKEKNLWIIIGAFMGYMVSVLMLHSPFVDIRINQCLVDRTGYDYLLWFPACFCGILVLNKISEWAVHIYSFHFLRFIGRNAMIFYVVHAIPLYITVNVLENAYNVPINSNLGIVCKTFVCMITILFLCGFIKNYLNIKNK